MFISKFYQELQAQLVLNNLYIVFPNNFLTIVPKEHCMLTTTRMVNTVSGGLHQVWCSCKKNICIFQGGKYFLYDKQLHFHFCLNDDAFCKMIGWQMPHQKQQQSQASMRLDCIFIILSCHSRLKC